MSTVVCIMEKNCGKGRRPEQRGSRRGAKTQNEGGGKWEGGSKWEGMIFKPSGEMRHDSALTTPHSTNASQIERHDKFLTLHLLP